MKISRQLRRFQEQKIVRSMMPKKERRASYSHLRRPLRKEIFKSLLNMAKHYTQ